MNRKGSYSDSFKGDDLFCCLLCVEQFRNPKILECHHAFCEHCLQVYYRTFNTIKYEQLGTFIACPTCKKLSKVPPNGFTGLSLMKDDDRMVQLVRKMSAINMNNVQRCDVCVFKNKLEESEFYCSKCSINLCSSCQVTHNSQPLFKNHTVIHISNKETINLNCDKHNKLPSTYFCLDCDSTACTVCVLHDHIAHHSVKLRDALCMRRDDVKILLNALGPMLDKTETKLKKLVYINAMEVRGKNGMQRSTSESYYCHKDTPIWERRKMSVFEKPSQNAKDEMDIQAFYIQIEGLKKLYDMGTKILEMSQSKKLLAVHEELKNRLTSVMDVEMVQIKDELEVMLEEKESKMNEILHSMSANGSVGSSLNDAAGSQSDEDLSSIEEVAMFDKPQKSLLIKPKLLWKVEKHKNDSGDLWNPCDIAFMADHKVVVAEYDIMNDRNNRLRIFDNLGKTAGTIGQGEIRPLGVVVNRDGNIAVTDCKGKRVKIFTPSGQLMNEWGKGQFGWPYGIVINSKGQYIVSDAFNDVISIHQPDGKRVRQFGTSGMNSSQFRNPYHIAVDANDNILVSDCGNHCFKVFDINGRYMFKSSEIRKQAEHSFIFESKRKRRKLRAPRGIAVDLRGNILIADDNCRVCMFDSQGKYVRNILTDEDSVKFAEALSTNDNGTLAVSEWNPNNMFAVKLFSLYE